jgi:zinc protease
LPQEPPQVSPRRAVVEKDVQIAQIMMGWHTVALQHFDLYALDVLAQVLGGGDSSRLVRSLREKQNLVTSISAFSSTPSYGAGIFGVTASLPPQNLAKIEPAVQAEIEKIKKHSVTLEEVRRAQRQIETSFVFDNQDVADQAERIATDYIGTGDPTFSEHYVERIKRVTPAQVRQVAWKYLYPSGRTTAIVKPRTKTGVAALPEIGSARASLPVTASRTQEAGALPPHMIALPNGMRLIIRENHASPTVAMVAMGLGGVRLEPQDKAGIANLAAEMLTRGTQRRSAAAIARVVDALGGSLVATGGYNSWVMSSQWLARDWRRGLSLMQESLLTPTFPDEELRRVKQQVLAAIKARDDDPEGAAGLLLRETFYRNHPYGRSALGTPQSLAGINRRDVQLYWNGALRPATTVLSIYGDVDAAEVERVVKYLFHDFKRAPQQIMPPAPPAPLPKFTAREELKPGLTQSVIFYGYPGVPIKDADRYAMTVLDGALSGIDYPGGRLHARLRDNQLVYGVHAYNLGGIDTAMFVVQAATTPDKRAQVQSIIEEEVNRLRVENISAEELERAKSMAIAERAISLQSNAAQAGEVTSDELFGLGFRVDDDYEQKINAITADDVRRVAQQYLQIEHAARAVVETKQEKEEGE